MGNEQAQQTFVQEMLGWLGEIWTHAQPDLDRLDARLSQPGWLIARCADHPYHAMMLESLRQLRERYPDPAALGALAADAYFHAVDRPDDHPEYAEAQYRQNMPWTQIVALLQLHLSPAQNTQQYLELRLLSVLNACIVEHTPPDIHERIRAYLVRGATAPDGLEQAAENTWRRSRLRLQDCLNLLVGLSPSPHIFPLLDELCPVRPWAPGTQWSYLMYDACTPFLDLLRALSASGALNYAVFRHIALLVPYEFMKDCCTARDSLIFRQTIETYQVQVVANVAAHLHENNCGVILSFEQSLRGSSWLFEAARLHSTIQPGELVGVGGPGSPKTVAQAIIRLARAKEIEPASEDERQELVIRLQQFPAATLKALFAVATHARHVLCVALGWQCALPLVELVESIAEQSPQSSEHYTSDADIPNSTDPLSGTLDVPLVRSVLARMDSTLANEALALLCRGKAGVENSAMLVRAVGGWNRPNVLQGLKRYGQVSIKAYGLLPLTRGEEEVLARYLELRKVEQQGRKFGSTRRATHAAAIQAAIANLAQVAGYNDAGHLEWAMEAKVVQGSVRSDRVWTVDSYQLQIDLAGTQVAISITRAGRVLKSVPKEVRTSGAYQEAKEAVAQLRTHMTRLRRGLLERLLETGGMLQPEELARILDMPTARALFEQLVLRTANGATGLLEADTLSLRGLDNTPRPIRGPVTIAHPYHLFQEATLAAWQREIVHRKVIQPVKQVFRELYVITPAEQETYTYSRRFEGHDIDGSSAIRPLTGRNWRVQRRGYDGDACACKAFPGMRAVFTFATTGHYFGEPGAASVAGQISFEAYPPAAPAAEQRLIPLEKVPPLIFSEVMRDADLVVSVAQTRRDVYLSPEIYARTGELIKVLLAELDIQGVTVDGHYAHVQGKLARYRIHLGSATIHIEPGSYLCIVPGDWGRRRENLFLPFGDDDPKFSEVISKILLLLADDQIKDESILRQIRG